MIEVKREMAILQKVLGSLKGNGMSWSHYTALISILNSNSSTIILKHA